MKIIDVDNIFDIPDFKNITDVKFWFSCFDRGDNTIVYSSKGGGFMTMEVSIICNEESFFSEHTLIDLTTFEDIAYFSLTLYMNNEAKVCYHYRPFVDKKDRVYE